jgi:hypothetical protein
MVDFIFRIEQFELLQNPANPIFIQFSSEAMDVGIERKKVGVLGPCKSSRRV